MMIATLALAGLAADEPCYEHARPDRISGTQFWVEYDPDVIDAEKAQMVLDAAEHARDVYRDELGWPFTDKPIVIEVKEDISGSFGIWGLTQTQSCDDGPVPRITLGVGHWTNDSGMDVVSHEVGHAAQYGYMGDYIDSVESWAWWMEGTATWITPYAREGRYSDWADATDEYLTRPDLALHHSAEGYLLPDAALQMYGTAYLATWLDEHQGGNDTIKAIWAYGGPHSGDKIFFPDAVNGAGLDFDAIWPAYLVDLLVLNVERRDMLGGPPPTEVSVLELPASGQSDDDAPQGLGFNIIRVNASAGEPKSAIQFDFAGDPAVPWTVVIARTNGEIIDYVPLTVGADGRASGWLSGFQAVDAWMVVSPQALDATPRAYSWEATLIDDPGPMDERILVGTEPEVKKGCDSSGSAPSGVLAILAALGLPWWRRRPRAVSPDSRR